VKLRYTLGNFLIPSVEFEATNALVRLIGEGLEDFTKICVVFPNPVKKLFKQHVGKILT